MLAPTTPQALTSLHLCCGAGGDMLGFQEAGFDVRGVDNDKLACDAARELFAQEGGSSFAAAVVKEFGRLDILVNNAGITRDNLAMRMKSEIGRASCRERVSSPV